MALASVAVLGLVVSLALSTILSVVILPPTRLVLQKSCPSGEGVSFWTRFTVLMLFLGPLIVTLIFGVPYSELSSKLSGTDHLIVRIVTSALVGSFLTLVGIGLRMGTLRQNPGRSPSTGRKSDDEFLK
jgi:hypothetical protein